MRFYLAAATLLAFVQPAVAYLGGEPGASSFPASVAIFSAERCTGVKIAAKKILTAAHCVWPDGVKPDASNAPRVTIADGTFSNDYAVSKYLIHPSWRPDQFRDAKSGQWIDQKSEDAVDLAIVETSIDIQGVASAILSRRPVVAGDIITVGGFGVGSPVGPREYGRPQIRELSVASKKVSEVLQNSFVVPPTDASSSDQHLSIAYRGDSGGPAYRCVGSDECEVVGINSWVDDLLNITFPSSDAQGAPIYSRFVLTGNKHANLHLKKLVDQNRTPDGVLAWLRRNAPDATFH